MNRPQEPLPGSRGSPIEFTNVYQNAVVGQRVTIVHGRARGARDGSILTFYYNNMSPSQRFPMVDGVFKALVSLETGVNKIRFETDDGQAPMRTELVLNYQPVIENPPVHFVLLLGKDSPGEFDSPSEKRGKEGNDLPVAVKKLRLASYLMAAYTQEQMSRNKFGFRSFRPFEQFEKCTLSNRDDTPQRSTTHIHVVRMKQTVAEIRDPDVAQQNPDAKRAQDLFGWAADALYEYGGPFSSGQFVQAACIYVDTHWDTQRKLVLGHAALGGGARGIQLAIFGGHTLHAWPTCFEDLPIAFLDETRTDTGQVANDANQSGSSWEALNIGQGAFMHEIGHLLGCPHEPDGIMLRGYLNWNRSFMATEGYSVRENKQAVRVVQPQDEGFWHRLDIMRFRYHPSFRLALEGRYLNTSKPLIFPLKDGIMARAPQGIYMIDVHADGDSRYHYEYQLPTKVKLSLAEIESKLEPKYRGGKIELHVHAPEMQQTDIDDVRDFINTNSKSEYLQSSVIGRKDGDQLTVRFPPEAPIKVCVWAGDALDGIEFFFPSGVVLFGRKGGKPHEIPLDRGDSLRGLAIRGGYWVDAAGIVTDKYMTQQFGGPGGSVSQLVPPEDKRIVGVTGWFLQWCYGISILYER